MTINEYQTVAASADIALGKTLSVIIAEHDILICHSNEGFYAVSNLCSHAAEKLSNGKLKGCRILCPLHGAAFDIRDGQALSKPASKPIRTYPLRIVDNQIQIQLGE